MLFILFDVETVFLYPWAVILRDLKMFGFWEMLVYIGIVLVGFFYIWKKGARDWARHWPGGVGFDGGASRHYPPGGAPEATGNCPNVGLEPGRGRGGRGRP